MKTIDREHVRSVVNTIFSQLLHTTSIDVINSWGISKMYATQIVKNVNGEDFTMAALVMQVNGFQFQGKVYIALDEGSDYYRIYGEKDGTKIIATNNERMGKKPMGVIQTRLTTIDMEENKIEIYRSADGKVELNVKLEKDTVWLTQNQMAELFGVDRTSIVRHIRNIYKVEELDEISTCAKNAQVRFEGSRKNIIQIFRVVWRRIEHHLIVILQHIT